jgi:hypothetical protein
MRTPAHCTGLALLMTLVLSGCAGNESSAHDASTRESGTTLSDRERDLARSAAQKEVAKQGATVTSATVTVTEGMVSETNTGYVCTSDRLLKLSLVGTFPHTVTTGTPVGPDTDAQASDTTVRTLLITVDSETGRPCQISVATRELEPLDGAATLAL